MDYFCEIMLFDCSSYGSIADRSRLYFLCIEMFHDNEACHGASRARGFMDVMKGPQQNTGWHIFEDLEALELACTHWNIRRLGDEGCSVKKSIS